MAGKSDIFSIFIEIFPLKPSISRGFPIATFDYQRALWDTQMGSDSLRIQHTGGER